MNRVYRHSGRVVPIGIVASLAAGVAAGFPLAFIYAWGIIRIPEEKLACIATVAYGALVGAAAALGGRWGKIRNGKVIAVLAGCAAAVSLYWSWAFWIKNVFHLFGREEISALVIMQKPHVLWKLIVYVNQYGTWGTTEGHPTNGTELWVIWFFEAIGVIGAAMATAVTVLRSQPFCERCGLWCSKTEKLCLSPVSDLAQAKLSLGQRDLSFLQKLGPGSKKASHLSVELHSCTGCQELNTLTLRQTFMQPRKFGAPAIKHVNLAEKLLVSRQEADAFRLAAHSIRQLANAAKA